MNLLAIDPGPETCGVVLLDVDAERLPRVLEAKPDIPVNRLLDGIEIQRWLFHHIAAERITGYAQKVGASTFATCEVYGRIWQVCESRGIPFTGLTRKDVKSELGLPTSAKGAQVNAVIKHSYPQTGGGATPSVGTKKQPGPLYGVKDHAWAALGVGMAWCFRREREQRAKELERLKVDSERRSPDAPLFDSTLQSDV